MAGIKHSKVSAKSDSGDTTLVRPSDWNDEHIVDGAIVADEISSPSTPSSGTSALYPKSDGQWYSKGDDGIEVGPFGASTGGGGGAAAVDRWHIGAFASTASHATTITAASSGQRMIVAIASYNRDVNTPTCTNVTFTEVLAASFSTTANLSVYVGVVAGGSSGTTVTVTATGADYIFATVIIIDDELTPTVVDTATKTGTNAAADQGAVIGPIDCSAGDFLIMGFATNDASQLISHMDTSSPMFLIPGDSLHGMRVAVGKAGADKVSGYFIGGTGGADYAAGIVALT